MKIEAEHVLCRFQLTNLVRHGLSTLYEWIVATARREGLHGATVLEGVYGLRADGTLIEERRWSIVRERPVIVEVVDEPARIDALLGLVEPGFRDGVITLERARVCLYRSGPGETRRVRTGWPTMARTGVSAVSGVRTMNVSEHGLLLRLFISGSDTEPGTGRPLYEAIVRRAREACMAGATVLSGSMGFGRHAIVHTTRRFELSTDLPMVIEIVDTEEKVQAFLPTVDELVAEGLVTLEPVRIVRYVSVERATA